MCSLFFFSLLSASIPLSHAHTHTQARAHALTLSVCVYLWRARSLRVSVRTRRQHNPSRFRRCGARSIILNPRAAARSFLSLSHIPSRNIWCSSSSSKRARAKKITPYRAHSRGAARGGGGGGERGEREGVGGARGEGRVYGRLRKRA